MQIEWQREDVSPYLFKQQGTWPGVRIHRAHVLPGKMAEHSNTFHELNVALNGTLITEKLSAGGNRVVTHGGSGSLCMTPAGQPISASWDVPIENMGFSIDPEFITRTAIENNFSANFEFVELYKTQDALIQHIGLTLLSEAESDSPAGKLLTGSLIQTLVLHLLTNYSTAKAGQAASGGLSGYRLRRVKEYIDANLEEDLSLSELASVAELSQYHFARSFRKTVGVTPQQYVMQQRIERAKELLSNAALPIVEVSLRSGFKNQSHFTTLFRKATRLTPKTWREVKLA